MSDGSSALEGPSATSFTLLVVEDHAEALKALTRLLEREGFRVVPAVSVADALLCAERAAAAGRPIDLLVSDIDLPDGSGLDLARQLQSRHGIRAIAITGFAEEDDERDSLAAGFECFLPKPVSIKALLTAIAELR